MSTEHGCQGCKHAKDLNGCATQHVGEARKLIAEGKPEEADKQLNNFQKHLK